MPSSWEWSPDYEGGKASRHALVRAWMWLASVHSTQTISIPDGTICRLLHSTVVACFSIVGVESNFRIEASWQADRQEHVVHVWSIALRATDLLF